MTEGENGRRTRRSREELDDLLTSAARSMLEEEGLTVGAGELTFKRVFGYIEETTGVRITNGSVIRRIWDSQDDYQADVLMTIASKVDPSGEVLRALAALPSLDAPDADAPPAERLAVFRQGIRVGAEASLRARLDTRTWSLWSGVWVLAVTSNLSGRRRGLRAAVVDGLRRQADQWEQIFTAITDHLGIRVREPLTAGQFTAAALALAEGLALRHGGDDEVIVVDRPTGLAGTMEGWTLFGIALWALVERFYEIDPEWSGQPDALEFMPR